MVKKLTKIDSSMSEEQFIKTVNCLLIFSCICMYHALLALPGMIDAHEAARIAAQPESDIEDVAPPAPKNEWWKSLPKPKGPEENPYLTEEMYFRNAWQGLDISYTAMDTTYLGRYFITAYCPEECGGSWTTSSGATCHQSSDWTEPNTVAIDRGYHKYGELLLIGDPKNPNNRQIVVTEDTGPGVRGHWCDVFVETMYQVETWNTRYDNVWRVSYNTHELDANSRREMHEMLHYLIHQPSELFGPVASYTYNKIITNSPWVFK